MAQPAYSFLGYSLNEISYLNKQKDNTYVGISIPKDIFSEESQQYSFLIRVATDFAESESYFIFQAGFQINDLAWYNSVDENVRKSLFFSIVFPFIREKIFSITSDTNPGLFIPTINVKEINFEKELRLIKATEDKQ